VHSDRVTQIEDYGRPLLVTIVTILQLSIGHAYICVEYHRDHDLCPSDLTKGRLLGMANHPDKFAEWSEAFPGHQSDNTRETSVMGLHNSGVNIW